jgi:hypothetical protein
MKLHIDRPNPRQAEFLAATEKYIAFGGARGGGKSWAVRTKAKLLALRYGGIRLLILRRTYQELESNHIRFLRRELFGLAEYRATDRIFTFPNGSTIEYTPTVTATNMTHETAGGKCINLTARPGSVSGTMASISGQYKTFDGLLLQWGSIDITPTATNTPTTKRVTFPIKYAQIPLVFTQAITSAPDTCSIAVMRSTVSDQTAAADIILTRTNTVNTVISWFAIGPT